MLFKKAASELNPVRKLKAEIMDPNATVVAFPRLIAGDQAGSRMNKKLTMVVAVAGLSTILVCGAALGQGKPTKPPQSPPPQNLDPNRKILRAPSGPGFYISPIEATPGQFTILLTDSDGRSTSGAFRLQQVSLIEAVLQAAKA